MLLRNLVRIINILIAAAAVIAIAGIYWFLWRPMPQTSGEVAAPVAAPVAIVLDNLGVPHIHAASQEDVFFAQGFATAQERLWQMDGLRRTSAGELSEIVGPATLKHDQEARRMRMRRIAENAYLTLKPQDRAEIAAYVRGVNFFIDTHRNALPFEFAAIGYSPRPWSVVDSILVGLYMYGNLTTSWPEEIAKRELLSGGDPAKVNFLFPTRAGSEVQPGSNAWVVSGAHTAHGHPQLSNDMHLEYSVPGIWYMIALHAPGLDVAGVSLPGLPGVIVGHNKRIAWGVTNLHFDVQDLYSEKLDQRTGQYLYQGKMEQARLERDIILIKGQKPVEVRTWVTRHGPVIVDNQDEHLAVRWTAAEPGVFQFPFTDIDRAANWQDFNAALARLPGPGQNFVYADVDGNIGYHATGFLPIRHKSSGDIPADGSTADAEWDGYIPYDQLPSAYNPPGGIIVTANQNPFPATYAYNVAGSFASPYRSNQIRNMLMARPKLTPLDALAIQKDVYSAFSHHLAHYLVNAYDAHAAQNTDLKDVADILRPFNGQIDKDAPAPYLLSVAADALRTAMADNASPGHAAVYKINMSYAAMDNLLRDRPAGWFADYDQTLIKILRDAAQTCASKQGRDPHKWRFGHYLQTEIDHPVGKQIPFFKSRFDIGPVPASGNATTVKQTTKIIGPSERMTVVVGDWDKSLLNVPIGQSGHVLSRHYRDQWDAYYGGTSFPMQFDHVDVSSTLTLRPN